MNNSFSNTINIILGSLFFGVLMLFFMFGNFGGISSDELQASYVSKGEANFLDLSKDEQKKYVSKSELATQDVDVDIKTFFDKNSKLIVDSNNIINLVEFLQQRLVFLQKENLTINKEKSKLAKNLQSEQNNNLNSKKNSSKNSLEKINEAEQQHYQNIKTLTKKINDLQRENIELNQIINKKGISLEEEINKNKLEVKNRTEIINQNEKILTEDYDTKLSKIVNNNSALKKKIEKLNLDYTVSEKQSAIVLYNSQNTITKLKDKISTLERKIGKNIKNNSLEILKIQDENSKKLQELDSLLKINNAQIAQVKKISEEKIEKVKNEYKNKVTLEKQDSKKNMEKVYVKYIESIDLERQNNKQNINALHVGYKEKISILNDKIKTLQSIQDKSKKSYQDTMLKKDIKFEKDKKVLDEKIDIITQAKLAENSKSKGKLASVVEKNLLNEKELIKKIDTLKKEKESQKSDFEAKLLLINTKLNIKKIDLTSLQKELSLNNMKSNKQSDNLLQLQDKIKGLEEQDRNIDIEVDELLGLNEKKHNENYKILNQRVASLQQKVDKQEKEDSDSVEKMENQVKVLNGKLKLKIDTIEKVKNESSKSNLKNREKLGKYVREITFLKKRIKDLRANNKIEKSKIKVNKPQKLKLVNSVKCDDMSSGNATVSFTCKTKVDKFLSSYNTSYFYEVVPIVGSGGFSSLERVRRDKNIPDSEVDRLTMLSNIGLGKARAKVGGDILRKTFGDTVKISYSLESLEINSKKGFVINVYK